MRTNHEEMPKNHCFAYLLFAEWERARPAGTVKREKAHCLQRGLRNGVCADALANTFHSNGVCADALANVFRSNGVCADALANIFHSL